jgi:hypothetical protein
VDLQERITDAERARAAADVQAAAGDGLLTLDEADERLAQVWAAHTSGELALARAELPARWLKERRRHEAALEAASLARKTLPAHIRSWLMLVALFVGIWALTTPGGYFWPVWPAMGTGICLVGHVAAARRAPAQA